jgi:hypothetical protein
LVPKPVGRLCLLETKGADPQARPFDYPVLDFVITS